MASVKLSKKHLLEQIQAKLVLIQGSKMSQQEILDKCIEFSHNHLAQFVQEQLDPTPITPEQIRKILDSALDINLYHQDEKDDDLLYGISKTEGK